jgi:hypothetical protein
MAHRSRGRWWAHGAEIEYHARRWMLTSGRCASSHCQHHSAISASNCRTVTCPLAQSVERIHGKEKSRRILLVR